MKGTSSDRPLVVSNRLYWWLLRAYPGGFRQEYGVEMAQVFRACCRKAYHDQGSWGLLRLWLPTLGDLTVTAFEERVMEGLNMSKTELIRWSGLAAILAGLAWAFLGLSMLEILLPEAVANILGAVALPFFLLGLLGLHAYQIRHTRQVIKALAWAGFAMMCSGLVLGINFIVVAILNLPPDDTFWARFVAGLILFGLGSALYATATIAANVLPRWSALGLLVGSLSPLLFVYTDGMYRMWSSPDPRYWLFVILWLLFAAGWVTLGYALWARPSDSTIPPALAG